MAKAKNQLFLLESEIAWALRHLDRFGDTDLLPIPIEYRIINKDCQAVSASLSTRDIFAHSFRVPRRVSVPKPDGAFRVASQLSAEDTIILTALCYRVSPIIERSRTPLKDRISCSYRVDLQSNGQFFRQGFGHGDFNAVTATSLKKRAIRCILTVDISDFYNQLSHHRIANNLATAGVSFLECEAIEGILNQLASNHHSRGVPVGSSGSILLAEAAALDIDDFLVRQGIKFCRYVDDFRFFFEDEKKAYEFLASFTEFLFINHRLSINSHKTRLWSKDQFGGQIIDGETMEEERRRFHLTMLIIEKSSSCEPALYECDEKDENAATRRAIDELFQKVQNDEPLPLGLAKFVLTRGRLLRTTVFSKKLLENLDHFCPVVREVVDYALAVDSGGNKGILGGVLSWVKEDSKFSSTPYMQEWAAYIAANSKMIFSNWKKIQAVFDGLPENVVSAYRPIAAARAGNWALVRNFKETLDVSGEQAKRAIVLSSCILASDEKKHWLGRFIDSKDPILTACAKYAMVNNTI